MTVPSVAVAPGVVMRTVVVEDADGLHRSLLRSREHMRPWEPNRGEDFYSFQAQRKRLLGQLQQQQDGTLVAWVLVESAEIVGGVTLSDIVLGPFRSGDLGYWIDVEHVGRGLATGAVGAACRAADELLQHR